MRFLTYIGNVVTGRFAHWNATNNEVIGELWRQSNEFPRPVKVAFQEFIGSSTALVNALLGPDKGADRLLKKDPLKVTRQQFLGAHGVIVECLAATFAKLNPSMSDPFRSALAILHGRNADTSRIIQLIDGMDQIDLMAIGCAAWEEIVCIVGSPDGTSAVDAYPFAALLGAIAADSFKDISVKINAGAA